MSAGGVMGGPGIDYPVRVVAVDSAGGTPLEPTVEEKAAADFRAMCRLVTWLAGHGACSWRYAPAEQVIRCPHGPLYEVGDPVPEGVTL